MAGDYLPIRLHLEDDPAVVRLAALTGLDRFGVVGRLVATWTWAGDHADEAGLIACHACNANGNAASVTKSYQACPLCNALRAHMDALTGCANWSEALAAVGWLAASPAGLRFPDWHRWNSKSARTRLLTARRVAEHRAKTGPKPAAACNANGNAASVTESLPEKRREELKESPPAPLATQEGRKPTKRDARKAQADAELRAAAAAVGLDAGALERIVAAVAQRWPRGKLTPAQVSARWAALGKPAAATLERALSTVALANPDAEAPDWPAVGRLLQPDNAETRRRDIAATAAADLAAQRAKAEFDALPASAKAAIVDDARRRLGPLGYLLAGGAAWGTLTRKDLAAAMRDYLAQRGATAQTPATVEV